MATTPPRQIGTLIVVILKARNLPNKRHIGKQDPYCSVALDGEKRRTKAIRRGGQHPVWDEEIRFTLFEGPDEQRDRSPNGDGTPPPPPPKSNGKGSPSIKGGKFMPVACYAEDPREPDLIGEANVDLTEVLTKGETDEWFTLMNKDKYSGEVYLELTFWSNEPAPPKKTQKPQTQKHYGGPGSFVPAGESSTSLSGSDVQQAIARLPSNSSLDLRRDNVPPSLRSSSSVAQLDLYVPPYETSRSYSSVDIMANDFGEMAVGNRRSRRQSLPPQPSGYLRQPSSSLNFPDPQNLSASGYHQGTYSDNGYDHPVTPTAPLPYRQNSLPREQYEPYQPQYESALVPASGYPPPARQGGPRYSLPHSSSGFMPVPTPASSGFVSPSSITPQPSGFTPLPPPTPAPIGYGPPPSHMPPQTQMSSGFSSFTPPAGPMPSASYTSVPPSGSYQQSFHQPPSGYPYQSYANSSSSISSQTHQQQQQLPPPPPPASVPPQSQMIPQQPYSLSASAPPQPQYVSPSSHTPPQQYPPHMSTPPPSHEYIPPPPPLNDSPPGGHSSGSRPLPQPSQSYQQHARRQSALPMPPSNSFSNPGPSIGYPSAMPYNPIPPPPPLPTTTPAPYQQGNQRPITYSPNGQQSGPYSPTSAPYSASNPPPTSYPQSNAPPTSYPQSSTPPMSYPPSNQQPAPGPPPPLPQSQSSQYHQQITRRPSLPLPPSMNQQQLGGYSSQQSAYQALPPPPPPPSLPPHPQHEPQHSYPSASQSQTFYPGPPPRPPTQPPVQQQYIPPQGGYPPAVTGGNW